MVKLSVIVVVVGHLQGGKVRELESGGGSRSVLTVVSIGGSAGSGVWNSALRQVFFCNGRTLMGGTHTGWR